MSRVYLRQALQQVENLEEPNYTPAEQVKVDEMKVALDNAVAQGLEPLDLIKMTAVLVMLSNRGVTPEQLQNNYMLISRLIYNTHFDTTDQNIDLIVARINNQ